MLNKIVTDTLVKVQDYAKNGKNRIANPGWKIIENYLIGIQSSLKSVSLLDDGFDKGETTTRSGLGDNTATVEAIFKGKNYRLLLSVSEPDVESEYNNRLHSLNVSGFRIAPEEYDKRDLALFEAIAKQSHCQFSILPRGFHTGHDIIMYSGFPSLISDQSVIPNIGNIINNVQKGTIACELYLKEQKKEYLDEANSLLCQAGLVKIYKR
jgi:hypothetical protein